MENVQTMKCKECGRTFTLTENNVKWYKDMGFELPKRCPSCRKKRRSERNGQ